MHDWRRFNLRSCHEKIVSGQWPFRVRPRDGGWNKTGLNVRIGEAGTAAVHSCDGYQLIDQLRRSIDTHQGSRKQLTSFTVIRS